MTTAPTGRPDVPGLSRADVLALCRRHEAYGASPTLTLHGDDSIVAAIRDVLLAMARRKLEPLALADALDRSLPVIPAPRTREVAIAERSQEPKA